MGTQPPSHKGGRASSPIIGRFLLCPNGWMHQDANWYGGRPEPRGLCVRCGPSPSPSQKGGGARGRAPQFSSHVYCGQTARWIKMALGMEVGNWSSPHCARWSHSSPPPKGGTPPIFDPSILWPNGWMQDATCYGGRPRSAQATLC